MSSIARHRHRGRRAGQHRRRLWLIWWTMRGARKIAAAANHPCLGRGPDRVQQSAAALVAVAVHPHHRLRPGLSRVYSRDSAISRARALDRGGAVAARGAAAHQAFEQRFAGFKGKSLTGAVGAIPTPMATAQNLFALNCSTCHGSDARGAKGFPNLTDQDWLWGGSEADHLPDHRAGTRRACMPAWGPVLGPEGVEQVLAYVLTLSGRNRPPLNSRLTPARRSSRRCVRAAMDSTARAITALGAPNLTDNIWLHGGSEADIRETITGGRTNHMPAQLERLGETKVRLLAAYVSGCRRTRPAPHPRWCSPSHERAAAVPAGSRGRMVAPAGMRGRLCVDVVSRRLGRDHGVLRLLRSHAARRR